MQDNLFSPLSWQTKIDFINHLVLFNNLLITVLAEKEGGKTSFIQLLQARLDPQVSTCVINAAKMLNLSSLIPEIVEKLNLDKEINLADDVQNPESNVVSDMDSSVEKVDRLPELSDLINRINERKMHVLLIVDNAQHLPILLIENILKNLQIQKDNACFFHVCLVSDYSVVAAYNRLSRDFPAGSIHTIELGSLNENETGIYVSRKIAGNKKAEKLFSGDQITLLYKMTGGCLSKVNTHLSNHMLMSNHSGRHRNKGKILKKTLGIGIPALFVFGLSFVFFSEYGEYLFDGTYKIPTLPVSDISILQSIKPEKTALLESHIPYFEEHGIREITMTKKQQVLAMLDEDDVDNNEQNQEVVENIRAIPKLDINKAGNISEQEEVENPQSISRTEAKENGYTIQVLASHKIQDIHRFIRTYNLKDQCVTWEVSTSDDSWYVLTMGEYETADQAKVAARDLSAELMRYKPWVRTVRNLKLIG